MCSDTWTAGDCTQYPWACTDPQYPWFKDVCKKTCKICGGGKNVLNFTHNNINIKSKNRTEGWGNLSTRTLCDI